MIQKVKKLKRLKCCLGAVIVSPVSIYCTRKRCIHHVSFCKNVCVCSSKQLTLDL